MSLDNSQKLWLYTLASDALKRGDLAQKLGVPTAEQNAAAMVNAQQQVARDQARYAQQQARWEANERAQALEEHQSQVFRNQTADLQAQFDVLINDSESMDKEEYESEKRYLITKIKKDLLRLSQVYPHTPDIEKRIKVTQDMLYDLNSSIPQAVIDNMAEIKKRQDAANKRERVRRLQMREAPQQKEEVKIHNPNRLDDISGVIEKIIIWGVTVATIIYGLFYVEAFTTPIVSPVEYSISMIFAVILSGLVGYFIGQVAAFILHILVFILSIPFQQDNSSYDLMGRITKTLKFIGVVGSIALFIYEYPTISTYIDMSTLKPYVVFLSMGMIFGYGGGMALGKTLDLMFRSFLPERLQGRS